MRRIVNRRVAAGQHVIVLGDLNEGPKQLGARAENLVSLYDEDSPLVEAYDLPGFDLGPRPGTFDSCGIRNRLDYLFISHSLVPAFAGGAIFRKGLWGTRKTRPHAWQTYPEITTADQKASDHAAIYLDLDI